MSFLSDAALQQQLVEALNANAEFARQAAVFDGSILLEVEADQLWLKIYKGKVIDHDTAVPAFGYTFKFSGPESAWLWIPFVPKATGFVSWPFLAIGCAGRYALF